VCLQKCTSVPFGKTSDELDDLVKFHVHKRCWGRGDDYLIAFQGGNFFRRPAKESAIIVLAKSSRRCRKDKLMSTENLRKKRGDQWRGRKARARRESKTSWNLNGAISYGKKRSLSLLSGGMGKKGRGKGGWGKRGRPRVRQGKKKT